MLSWMQKHETWNEASVNLVNPGKYFPMSTCTAGHRTRGRGRAHAERGSPLQFASLRCFGQFPPNSLVCFRFLSSQIHGNLTSKFANFFTGRGKIAFPGRSLVAEVGAQKERSAAAEAALRDRTTAPEQDLQRDALSGGPVG